MGQRVEPVRALVVVEKTTTVAPTAASVLHRFGRLPFPRPVELHGRTAFRRVVAHQLHVRVVLQIGVRMELARDQVIQLFRIGRMRKRQPREHRVCHLGQRCRHSVDRRRWHVPCLRLSHDKGELERQVIVVGQAQQERRDCGGRRKVRILPNVSYHFFLIQKRDSHPPQEGHTWIYSMGLSSPASRLAEYLAAGKEFGVRFSNTRFLELTIDTFDTVTIQLALPSSLLP